MKRKLTTFWSFFIQFCVVVLGVFITLWIGNITENKKQKKSTRLSLEMIRNELVDYYTSFTIEEGDLSEKSLSYSVMLSDTLLNTDPELLRHYKRQFIQYSSIRYNNIALETAEKINSLNTIKDPTLIESIYSSYAAIDIYNDFKENINTYKWDQFLEFTTRDNRNSFFNEAHNSTDGEIIAFWRSTTNNDILYRAIVHNKLYFTLAENTIPLCKHHIRLCIDRITDYLKDGSTWNNPIPEKI